MSEHPAQDTAVPYRFPLSRQYPPHPPAMSLPFNDTSQQQMVSAALLVSSAAPAMSLFTHPMHIDHKPHAAPDPSVAAATSYPVSAATAAAIAATLGRSPPQWNQPVQPITSTKSPNLKSPAAIGSGKINAVKAGGVHKSKGSTSSVSSSSTVGTSGGHRRMPSASASTDSSERDDDDAADEKNNGAGEVNEKQKRRRFLERNRIAASKCRQKKKMWVQELERRAEDVTMQNRSLHIAVAQLKEEVLILKNQLLAHRSCNCSAIHQYLHSECAHPQPDVAMPLSAQPPRSLMSPPPPSHMHHRPASNAAVAAAVTGAGASAAAQPLMLQPQNYGPQIPAHHHASSVDLSSIASNNPAISAALSSADAPTSGVFGSSMMSDR